MVIKRDMAVMPRIKKFLPVVSKRRPRFAAAVLVTVVFEAVFGAHVVERARNGRLPGFEDIV